MDDGQVDPPNFTFRVVGICPDNSRIALAEGLTRKRAEEVRNLLLNANVFRVVEIEPYDV